MSKFEHSFEKIYEALITRYTAGCFSAGDVVKFDTKAIQKSDAYKGLTKSLKTRLDDMMRTSDAGETVIVVTDVTLGHDNPKSPAPTTMTVAYSHGGGRWVEPITIPGALAEFMDAIESGVNLVDKIPSVSKITYPVSTEAEEVDLKELEKNRTKGHASSTLHGESINTSMNKEEMSLWNSFRSTLAKNSASHSQAAAEEKRVYKKFFTIRAQKGEESAKEYLKSLIEPFLKSSKSLHGESIERDEYGTRHHVFEIGEKFKADYDKKHYYKVIKRNKTHVVLQPIPFKPEDETTQPESIKRKITKSYMPQTKEYCENARISPKIGYIYADTPYLIYAGSSTLHGESFQVKKPSKLNIDDYGINKFGGRTGEDIYAKKNVNANDIEDFMKQCRTEFGLKNGAEAIEKWNGFTQPFLKAAKNIMVSKGDKGLISYFSKFADFVLKRLSKWEYITDKLPAENSKIDKWNTDRSNELGKSYKSTEIDYYSQSLTYIKANWKRYWDWDSADVHECGGQLRRSYANEQHAKGGDWSDAYDHFIELTNAFTEKI